MGHMASLKILLTSVGASWDPKGGRLGGNGKFKGGK